MSQTTSTGRYFLDIEVIGGKSFITVRGPSGIYPFTDIDQAREFRREKNAIQRNQANRTGIHPLQRK